MKYVVIGTKDIFKILALFQFDISKTGYHWCEGRMTEDNLKVLDDNGYWYRIL
jgi:hypothetical protein